MDNTKGQNGKDVVIDLGKNVPPGNNKVKYHKITSITDKYQKSISGSDSIYSDKLLKSVYENNLEECKQVLENGYDFNIISDDHYFHPLLLAAKKGRYEIMELLLDNGADINNKDKEGCTALHHAIQQGNINCYDLLIEKGISIEVKDKVGNLPLHIAASEGILRIVTNLLERGSIPNAQNKKGQTPLHLVCIKGDQEVLSHLMDTGGRWDLKDVNSWIPLHCAAFHGHSACCDTLVERSGDRLNEHINYRNKDQATPLILAAKKGHSRCCQSLAQADINAFDNKGNTALHFASSVGFSSTIEVLLEMKPNINTRNRDGNTPIHKASMQKNLDCLKTLVEYPEADPGLNNQNQTVIHLTGMNNCDESLKYLLDIPAYKLLINNQDIKGKTALHLSLNQLHEESSEILVTSGIDCFITDDKGNIPLHVAAGGGLFTLCKFLLSGNRNASVNLRNLRGTTPLHLAAMNGSEDCCKILLTKGANLYAIDSNDFSPFHVASNEGNLGLIRLFTKRGSSSIINHSVRTSGDTPLHLTAKKGHHESCNYILKNMKKDLITKLNNNGNSALKEAFNAKHDNIFASILLKIPFPDLNEKYRIQQYYPFQSSLHEYMHEAIKCRRETVSKAIIESKWWYSGFSSSFCADGQCPNLIDLTRANLKMAEDVYDKCIEEEDTSIIYNFRIFEDSYYSPLAHNNGDDLKRESPFDVTTGALREDAILHPKQIPHPLIVAADCEAMRLMEHPLSEEYLQNKLWSYLIVFQFIDVLFQSMFNGVLGYYLKCVQNYDMLKPFNLTKADYCSGSDDDLDFTSGCHWNFTCVLFIFLVGFAIILAVRILYFNLENLKALTSKTVVRLICLIGVLILLVPLNFCIYDIAIKNTLQWQIGIITVLFSWFHLILTVNEIPFLSVFMPITNQFIMSFMGLTFYMLSIVFGFGFVFHLLLHEKDAFEGLWVAFIKTTVWMLGDLGYDDMFLDKDSPVNYPIMTNLIFLLLVTSISGFLINLVISKPTEHFEVFRTKAALHKAASMIRSLLESDSKLRSISRPITRKYLICSYVKKKESVLPAQNRVKEQSKVSSIEDDVQEESSTTVLLTTILKRIENIESQMSEFKKGN